MTQTMANAREMLAAFDGLDPDMPLGFATEAGEIGGAYHITELKLAEIRSIDCGGQRRGWHEATLQLLDGHGVGWMAAGKAAGILRRALDALPQAEEVPLQVEFGHGNSALGRYEATALTVRAVRAVVALTPLGALCKPAAEIGCCGPQAKSARCCG